MAHDMYVMITGGGDSSWVTHDLDDLLSEARMHCFEYVSNFMRHELPKRLTDEDRGRFDMTLLKVTRDELHFLPVASEVIAFDYQAVVDEYYDELRDEKQKELAAKQDPEWAEYQRLCEKFRGL